MGLGAPLAGVIGASIDGLRTFPAQSGVGATFPSTQGALWAFFGGEDAGVLLQRARTLLRLLGDAVYLEEDVLAFRYQEGRDLTGYEDGTENPRGDLAVAAALVSGAGEGLDGGSFVAAQRWVHDLAGAERLAGGELDNLIGRHRQSNRELPDAPLDAHVKRAAQESFQPPAFMLRRSMPWGTVSESGLYFVAYGRSLDAFEQVLRRMGGAEDGVVDGLLTLGRAVSGGYYWCPPQRGGKLDLRALGVG